MSASETDTQTKEPTLLCTSTLAAFNFSLQDRWGHGKVTAQPLIKKPLANLRLTALPSSGQPVLLSQKMTGPTYQVAVTVLGKVSILGAPLAMLSVQPQPRAVKKLQPTRPSSYLWHGLVGLCTYQVMGWVVWDREQRGTWPTGRAFMRVQDQMKDHIAPMSGWLDLNCLYHYINCPLKWLNPTPSNCQYDSRHYPLTTDWLVPIFHKRHFF